MPTKKEMIIPHETPFLLKNGRSQHLNCVVTFFAALDVWMGVEGNGKGDRHIKKFTIQFGQTKVVVGKI